jgi:hypothetical protein
MIVKIHLPPLLAINENIAGNLIQGLAFPSMPLEANLANYSSPKTKGKILIPLNNDEEQVLLVEKNRQPIDSFSKVILVNQKQIDECTDILDLSSNTWLSYVRSEADKSLSNSITSIIN